MTVAILMPVYNEGHTLERTLESIRLRAEEFGGVVVFLVDDGSQSPVRMANLPTPSGEFRVTLARHAINLGQGAALETARQISLTAGAFAAYVTMDSDG